MINVSRPLRPRKSLRFAGPVGAVVLTLLLGTSRVQADIVTTFDTGLDGWTGDPSQGPASQYSWGPSGGNPGGYFNFIDQAPTSGTIDAPSQFRGNWSSYNGTGTLSWDHIIFSTGGDVTSYGPFQANISGPGGSAQFTTAVNDSVVGQWLTVTAPIKQTDWSLTSGTWTGLLADVTSLSIVIELVTNGFTPSPTHEGDHDGIDNVILANSAVPEPSGLTLAFLSFAFGVAARFRRRRRKAG
jgi:hypothetical protein